MVFPERASDRIQRCRFVHSDPQRWLAYHLDSPGRALSSRVRVVGGTPNLPERKARYEREVALMRKRWGESPR